MNHRITIKGYISGLGWHSVTLESETIDGLLELADKACKRFTVVKSKTTVDTTADDISGPRAA